MPSPTSQASSNVRPSQAAQFQNGPSLLRSRSLYLAITPLMVGVLAFAGCAGMPGVTPSPGGPIPGANTTVTVQMAGTSNDQLSRFALVITGITLTSKAGKTVTLFSNSNPAHYVEAIHLNAKTEPFITVSVPQDIYTSAAVNVGRCNFTNVTILSGGLDFSTYDEGLCPREQETQPSILPRPSPSAVRP